MNVYFADTNFYLRFLLRDNLKQVEKTKEYLKRAKKGELRITFISEAILEMNFVLKSVFSIDRIEIADQLLNLVKTSYVDIEDRDIWSLVLSNYKSQNIDLLDIYLFFRAKRDRAEVLSYDKDFVKLDKRLKIQTG